MAIEKVLMQGSLSVQMLLVYLLLFIIFVHQYTRDLRTL